MFTYKLTEVERLTLHDIMTSMALLNERIEKHKLIINMCMSDMEIEEGRLSTWKIEFDQKLKAHGLNISMVNIDANTGKVSSKLMEQVDAASK